MAAVRDAAGRYGSASPRLRSAGGTQAASHGASGLVWRSRPSPGAHWHWHRRLPPGRGQPPRPGSVALQGFAETTPPEPPSRAPVHRGLLGPESPWRSRLRHSVTVADSDSRTVPPPSPGPADIQWCQINFKWKFGTVPVPPAQCCHVPLEAWASLRLTGTDRLPPPTRWFKSNLKVNPGPGPQCQPKRKVK